MSARGQPMSARMSARSQASARQPYSARSLGPSISARSGFPRRGSFCGPPSSGSRYEGLGRDLGPVHYQPLPDQPHHVLHLAHNLALLPTHVNNKRLRPLALDTTYTVR